MRKANEVFKHYTVPQLKHLLQDKDLSIEGKKEDLLQRLNTYYEDQLLTNSHPLPKGVRPIVSHFAHKDLFYFHERLKQSYTLGDSRSIQTEFLPDSIEIVHEGETEVILVNKSSKILQEAIAAFPEFEKITFHKEHLKVDVLNHTNDFQIYIYLNKPELSIPAYIIKIESKASFPKKKMTFHQIVLTQQSKNQDDFNFDELDLALPDLLLGLLWVQTYVLKYSGKINTESLDLRIHHDVHRPRMIPLRQGYSERGTILSISLALTSRDVFDSYKEYLFSKLKHKSFRF